MVQDQKITGLRVFCADDLGAVTVDWVVLAGAVVALGLGVLVFIEPGVDNGASVVSDRIGTAVDQRLGQSELTDD